MKRQWIIDKLNYFKFTKDKVFLNTSKREYLQYKERAKLLVENRINHYNKFYNFKINKITIKNQKSRWGSCSKKENLNFNYKIALLPQNLADYVIVHELCHLGEFNHSKKFWKLVSLTITNYKQLKKKFK
ncbi:MAG: M48 family metallopeptidase [Patescibacteria group bacterium]